MIAYFSKEREFKMGNDKYYSDYKIDDDICTSNNPPGSSWPGAQYGEGVAFL